MARKQKEQPIRTPEWVAEQLLKKHIRPSDVGLTYKDCHDWRWTSSGQIERFVQKTWPDLTKGGITLRSRKLWNKVYDVAHPSDRDRVEGSLWEVNFYFGSTMWGLPGVPQRPSSMNSWDAPLDAVHKVAYLSAATDAEARQLAIVTLGPLAMMGDGRFLNISRVGPDGWKAKELNETVSRKSIEELIKKYRESIEHDRWALNQYETMLAFNKMDEEE